MSYDTDKYAVDKWDYAYNTWGRPKNSWSTGKAKSWMNDRRVEPNSSNIEKPTIESNKTIIDDRKELFSWDNIPGNDHERLIEFLNRRFGRRFGIEWLKTPKIKKIDGGRAIKVFAKRNFLLIRLNDKKTKVNLKFDDGRTERFITKMENGKLNIYDINSCYANLEIIKSNAIKLCKSCKEINKCHLKNEFIDLCPKIISN